MPVSTSAVKVNPVTGALIDPPVATFAAANGLLTSGTSDAKNSVRAATTTNGTLATAFENGDTIDGIVLATSDRILIKDQSAPAENGIYVVAASGAPTRSTDFDAWTEIVGAFVSVEAGTVNAGTQWLCNVVAGGTLGTTAITFVAPKNYVDLTTTQTVTGAKQFTSGSSTFGGVAIHNNFLAPAVNCSFTFPDANTQVEFTGSTDISIHATGATAVTLPTSGTLLSSAAIGVSVQAYDADLTTWAGITPGANVGTALAVAVGSAGAFVTFNGAGGTPSSLTLTNATGLLVAGGGTGRATSTTAYGLIAAGTTATGAHQTLAAGAITEMLVGGGASALPAWTQIDYLARITADQTVTNSTTLVDATNLSLSIPAGTYELDYFQCSYGDVAAGGKYNINFSTAVDASWRSSIETNNTSTASSFRIYRQSTGLTDEATNSSGIGGTTWYGRKNGIFIAASACVVKIQFANVTAAGNTVLQSGTYLRLRRIVK